MHDEPFHPPQRILMGPGPCDVDPRVYRALSAPVLGHLDPQYLTLLDRIAERLRRIFAAPDHALTGALPGTGSAGMEACMSNLIEPGDRVVIGVAGYFGERLVEMATRAEARVVRVDAPWGEPVAAEALAAAIDDETRLVALVHGETSTGVLQPMEDVADVMRGKSALLVLDTVTSLGTTEVHLARWGVDAAYSCTQKGLGCVAGLSPVSFGPRAVERIRSRKTPPRSWYLDMNLLQRYWGAERVYHHTSSSTLSYALNEALRIVEEEGIAARAERHRRNARALVAGLEAMGLEMVVDEKFRLPAISVVRIPQGVDDVALRRMLLEKYDLEIGGGLGIFKGNAWRIGLMGHSSHPNNITLCLAALEAGLAQSGFAVRPGAVRVALESLDGPLPIASRPIASRPISSG